jgi:Domain of unknown function (DUF4440)
MKSILAFAILAAVMYACGLGDTKQNEAPPANTVQTPKKQDKEALLSELLKMENDLSQAGVDGDITMLAKYTTDDFELTRVDGKVQNKNEALAEVKKEKTIRSFSINEGDLLSFTDDSAVLRYTLNVTLRNGRYGSARVTDSFVKRNNMWMIKSEQQTLIRK